MTQGSLGPYRIVRQLGRGGMGVVYSVTHPDMPGRTFALKLLERTAITGQKAVDRFLREGEALARVSHPNVVGVSAAGEAPQGYYLVTDEVQGESLKAVHEKGPLSPEETARIGLRLCGALEAVHAEGVLHRDLKPDNVILQLNREPVLIDFGLAKDLLGESLTQSGTMLGTPAYMAPEQANGQTGKLQDPRVDVYGLGATLFALATGRPPYRSGGGHLAQVARVLEGKVEWPDAGALPPDLEAVLRRALATHQYARYPSVSAMATDLRRLLDGKRVRPRRWPLALAGVLVLALILGAVHALREPLLPPPPALLLSIESPGDGEVVREEAVEVRGRVAGMRGGAYVSCGKESQRVSTESPLFSLSVQLVEGDNTVLVRVAEPSGRKVVAQLSVHCRSVPKWYDESPVAKRPPLPLPQGLRFRREPGEYEHAKGPVLVWIPPGTYRRGRDPVGGEDVEDEGPAHEVRLTRGWFMGKYEVSCAEYLEFCAETPRFDPPAVVLEGPMSHPARGVTWKEASAFCGWAGLRLPTEAEWEYAARGEDRRPFPWGSEKPGPKQANLMGRDDGYEHSAPVREFLGDRSPFGCQQMAGNVREWAADRYEHYSAQVARERAPLVDPRGPPGGADRVCRGGTFDTFNPQWLTTDRVIRRGSAGYPKVGFRVALSGN